MVPSMHCCLKSNQSKKLPDITKFKSAQEGANDHQIVNGFARQPDVTLAVEALPDLLKGLARWLGALVMSNRRAMNWSGKSMGLS
ncbi:hypothetical protein ACY03_06075 [Salmonella enterica subsp. enterica serovar Senftenberg]|nr:hypothetical protein [Salmonella enterica subsp. enterica serovar Senftenberg]EBG1764660.1 hypothetical protein [Salmonella enterica]EFB1870928.1 hypothetical protein [Escherichia coli]EGT4256228.1 hypothetical protein [Citrobacter amalonaticus]KJL93205.1 hypothetical protein SS39_24220 [Enterobacter chengduensis]MBD9987127.1 hypothetical protein [Citrobacter portucalensis]QDE42816.1 hypothetical protein E6P06_06010 [Citrobacter sp. CF971]